MRVCSIFCIETREKNLEHIMLLHSKIMRGLLHSTPRSV